LDFEHFKETGRIVTGLDYYAWPNGPVPVALHDEIQQPKADLAGAVMFTRIDDIDWDVRPNVDFNDKLFSRRELRIMTRLADIFKEADDATLMIDSHMPNEPWDLTYRLGQKYQKIEYKLVLNNPGAISEDHADGVAAEDAAMEWITEDSAL
jgi:hypothetical protein